MVTPEILHCFGGGVAIAKSFTGEGAFEQLANQNGFEFGCGRGGIANMPEVGRCRELGGCDFHLDHRNFDVEGAGGLQALKDSYHFAWRGADFLEAAD